MSKRHWNREGDFESLFLRLEELVLANSGEDEFEEVFKLVLAKLWDERCDGNPRFYCRKSETETFEAICSLLRETENAWPGVLGKETLPKLRPEHLHVCVDALSRHSLMDQDLQVLDDFFENLVSRSAKGSKGQYFTPRHVVEFCVRALRPTKTESVCDPGCGSGGFLVHTLNFVRDQEGLSAKQLASYCHNRLWGFDIDGRAIRVAKALMLLAGDGKANVIRLNSLLRPDMGDLFSSGSPEPGDIRSGGQLTIEDVCRGRMRHHTGFDVIVTNPPFAGEIRERDILDGYRASQGKSRAERDVLFLERCIQLLKPGGRLGIVLPHNKFAGSAFQVVRKRLIEHARVLGVVALGRHTFLPHTHQKASVLFVQRRPKGEVSSRDESIFFAVSNRDGKDSKGRFILRSQSPSDANAWRTVDHDLDVIVEAFHHATENLDSSKFAMSAALCNVRKVRDLGGELVLAPERYDPRRSSLNRVRDVIPFADVVEILRTTVNPAKARESSRFLVLDTSDAREGVVTCRKPVVAPKDVRSAKKSVSRGCIIISRLRPYLRQVALIDNEIPGWDEDIGILCSTEFFVLRSTDQQPISFLVPFLLSDPVQTLLAASQEGGHHPRFDRDTLTQLPIPGKIVRERERSSARVEEAIAMFRKHERLTKELIGDAAKTLAEA